MSQDPIRLAQKFHISKATVTFGGRLLVRTEEVTVEFGAETLDLDNVQDVQESAGHFIVARPVTIKTNLLNLDAETFQLAAGYTGAIRQVGSAQVVDLDDSSGEPPEGTLTLVGVRADGAPITLHLKRTQAIPGSASQLFHKKQQGKLAVTFRKVDANDGTGINGYYAFGDMT